MLRRLCEIHETELHQPFLDKCYALIIGTLGINRQELYSFLTVTVYQLF